jgi:serine phosphatase RsbU (regulator of sigma subunit)
LLSGAAAPSRHYGVEAVYLPATEVGGDLYYWLPDDNGGFTLVVGDVSGKGLQAALQVSLILGALRETKQRQPGPLLSHLNAVALGQTGGGFVTCCCMHFSESGTVAFANAGHLAPYCRGREVETPGALPLGIVADAVYPETVFTLGSDDQLTILSDGVVEASNSRRELFGFDRVGEISQHSASQIAEAARAWGQQDDITVVTVRHLACAESAARL